MRFSVYVFAVAIAGAFMLAGAKESYADETLSCETDTDCVVIEGVCPSEWGAVNKAHESKAKGRIARMQTMVECAASGGPADERPPAACQDNQCVVIMTKDAQALKHEPGMDSRLSPLPLDVGERRGNDHFQSNP